MNMFEKIENCILLGIDLSFKKEISGFLITLNKGSNEESVVLPLDHLTEHKIVKYIDLMISKI